MKKLKQFSYNVQWGNYKDYRLYISATSQKQVIEMMEKLGYRISSNDIRNYFLLWGTNNEMEGIEITEPCIYAIKGGAVNRTSDIPKRII